MTGFKQMQSIETQQGETNMNPNNRFFKWLGVISAIVGIVGFLMQVGAAPVLAPLIAIVNVPVWLLICVLFALPWVVASAIKHSIALQLQRIDESQKQIAELEKQRAHLEAQASAASARSQEATLGMAAILKLDAYESLEQEIVGQLKGGERLSLLELEFRTSASRASDGKQRIARAIASLGARISGSSGSYQLVERHDA